MECLGCPAKLVAVVRSLYSQSTKFVCPWMESWLLHLFKKRAPGKVLAYRLVSDASGFRDESGRFGMRGIRNDGIRG